VTASGPAASAGIRAGDVITTLGGEAVSNSSALSSLVDEHKPGDTVTVTLTRDGQRKTLQVKLGERPATTATDTSSQQQGGGGQGFGW
jgi:putative serine protease PepD